MIAANSKPLHRERGAGELVASRIDRRMKMVKGLLFGIGLACGAYIGFYIGSNDLDFGTAWPPAIAAGIASLYVLAMLFGSIALSRLMDEVERVRSYKAAAFAGSVYLVVYPVWFLLWKGGFLIEPIHWALFAGFWACLAGAALYYRLR